MIDPITWNWVKDKISKDPEKYGSDGGGHELAGTYLYCVHPDGGVIPSMIVQRIPTIYRERRRYLDMHPEHDKRINALRYRKHYREVEHKGQTHIDFDTLTSAGAKELIDELVDHISGGVA